MAITRRYSSLNDYVNSPEAQMNPYSIPIMEMPISPEEARKEDPQTAVIRMLVLDDNPRVTPKRSFIGEGALILARTPNWDKVCQDIYEATAEGNRRGMLDALFRCAAEYLELEDLSDIFDFVVPISAA